MKKFWKSLPSARYIATTVGVCLVIGVVTAGGLKASVLLWLLIAAVVIYSATVRNMDPAMWESRYEPAAYVARVQRNTAATKLRAVIDAYDSGDTTSIDEATAEARAYLAKLPPSTAR